MTVDKSWTALNARRLLSMQAAPQSYEYSVHAAILKRGDEGRSEQAKSSKRHSCHTPVVHDVPCRESERPCAAFSWVNWLALR